MDLIRVDVLLANKYSYSRQYIKDLISEGLVKIDGNIVKKQSQKVLEDSIFEIDEPTISYVSRGGFKLLKAINFFNIDVLDKVCIDIGASTGGFTDCLLQNGAKKVYALDVGTMQLSDKLLNDPRIISIENTNVKDLTCDIIKEKADIITIDVSFISLTKVLTYILDFLKEDGFLVCLIKPQFEAGHENINRNGVVKGPKVHNKVLNTVLNYANEIGFNIIDLTVSPVKGHSGNTEYLLYANKIKKDNVVDIKLISKKVVIEAFAKEN